MDLNLRNIRTVERTKNVNDDIEAVRRLFSRFYFDEEKTKPLTAALEGYRKQHNDKTGEFMNSPLHDKHSHAADAMRTLARGYSYASQGSALGKESDNVVMSDFF